MLEEIRQLVKSEADEDDWKYHLVPVLNYSKKLAVLLGADEEIVELAALLHDIGRIRIGDEDHDVTGAEEAEKILKQFNCPAEKIEAIKHCVRSHRSRTDVLPQTLAAKIIANADAMAHFDILPVFFYWRSKKMSFEDTLKWVEDKMERNWNKKITLPEARAMIEEKYRAIRLILDSNKQYL